MATYNYIKVALLSQEDSKVTTEYTYPDNSDASWVATAGRPGTYLDYFLNARDAYIQWTEKDGNYFALVFRNPFATREGYHMIAIKVDAGFGMTGKQLVSVFQTLRKRLFEERRRGETTVDEILAECGVAEAGRSYDSWRISPSFVSREGAVACYRTYVSKLELENFLTFPRQQEYENYSRVIYVAATTSLRPGVELHHVTAPIRNIYTITAPEGVEISRPSASAGDRIMLTFSKKGFANIREAVIVGRPSLFATYDGATMIVKSAAECHLVFIKRIPLTVRSAKGGMVTGYTVSVNGRPVNTMEPYLEVTEEELNGRSSITIQVNSNNFETLKVEMTPSELSAEKSLELVLKPLEQGITLRLDFGEGRIFEQKISLEKNTPEYSQLHSGNFHGFRALKLTLPGAGETYNVDVRAAAKPKAPAFAKASSSNAQDSDAPSSDIQAPVFKRETRTEEPTPLETERRTRRRNNNLGMWIGAIVLICLIAGAAFYLRNQLSSTIGPDSEATEAIDSLANAVETVDVAEESVAEPAKTVEPEQAPTLSPAESHDIAYLNNAKEWRRDSLTSANGQALYDAIVEGDIPAAASNPYFSVAGRATNADAIKLIDMLWGAHATPTEKSNQRCMTKLKGQPIVLHDLYEDVARYRPADRNPEPRPGQETANP